MRGYDGKKRTPACPRDQVWCDYHGAYIGSVHHDSLVDDSYKPNTGRLCPQCLITRYGNWCYRCQIDLTIKRNKKGTHMSERKNKSEVSEKKGFMAIAVGPDKTAQIVDGDDSSSYDSKLRVFKSKDGAQEAVTDTADQYDENCAFYIYEVKLVACSEPVSKIQWATVKAPA